MADAELLKIIAKAAREGATELDLSSKGITKIPQEIGELTNLQSLDFRDNHITEIPEFICQLNSLKWLKFSKNKLTNIPEYIGQLTNLKLLDLSKNKLTEIPKFIGQLTSLEWLDLSENKITEIPEFIGQLTELELLDFSSSQLTKIPKFIGQLTNLEWLSLGENKVTEIPESIGQLTNLQELYLHNNPLNPVLRSAYDSGLDELKAYLNSIQEPEQREEFYEAKLVLVGEGAVGKTTLLKALTGQDPQNNEPTTHGVDIAIQALRLPHPHKKGVEIKLNAWDFGGQEVYRVTHQFFFSKRSVYLLVWEPRRGVQQCQVEDWLKLLRLRVGHEARVIIISTYAQSGQHIARIDKPVLQRDFGEMIVGFHEVDSLVDDPATGENSVLLNSNKRLLPLPKNLTKWVWCLIKLGESHEMNF
ncbi:MAG: hypothetical protein F6J86_29885 [Symploca sp. SIO1B1]|nr:hypothetical protein [Symploca sp. SIO1B1]